MWSVDPWGPERDDLRSAVQSYWNRGGNYEEIEPAYPYLKDDSDDEDVLSLLDADRKLRDSTSTPEPSTTIELHEIDEYR